MSARRRAEIENSTSQIDPGSTISSGARGEAPSRTWANDIWRSFSTESTHCGQWGNWFAMTAHELEVAIRMQRPHVVMPQVKARYPSGEPSCAEAWPARCLQTHARLSFHAWSTSCYSLAGSRTARSVSIKGRFVEQFLQGLVLPVQSAVRLLKLASTYQRPANTPLLDIFVSGRRVTANGAAHRVRQSLDR